MRALLTDLDPRNYFLLNRNFLGATIPNSPLLSPSRDRFSSAFRPFEKYLLKGFHETMPPL
jgi:hypothetical protein